MMDGKLLDQVSVITGLGDLARFQDDIQPELLHLKRQHTYFVITAHVPCLMPESSFVLFMFSPQVTSHYA